MRCPTDGTELQLIERQGVEVDLCPECWGIWLDRGELEKLVDRMNEPGRREPRLWSDRRLRRPEPVAVGNGYGSTHGPVGDESRSAPRPPGSFAEERASVRGHRGGKARNGRGSSLLQELLDLRGEPPS